MYVRKILQNIIGKKNVVDFLYTIYLTNHPESNEVSERKSVLET